MYKPYYGEPVMSLRLPRWQRAALHRLARQRDTTTSALVRALIDDELTAAGLTPISTQPHPGQDSIDEIPDA